MLIQFEEINLYELKKIINITVPTAPIKNNVFLFLIRKFSIPIKEDIPVLESIGLLHLLHITLPPKDLSALKLLEPHRRQ